MSRLRIVKTKTDHSYKLSLVKAASKANSPYTERKEYLTPQRLKEIKQRGWHQRAKISTNTSLNHRSSLSQFIMFLLENPEYINNEYLDIENINYIKFILKKDIFVTITPRDNYNLLSTYYRQPDSWICELNREILISPIISQQAQDAFEADRANYAQFNLDLRASSSTYRKSNFTEDALKSTYDTECFEDTGENLPNILYTRDNALIVGDVNPNDKRRNYEYSHSGRKRSESNKIMSIDMAHLSVAFNKLVDLIYAKIDGNQTYVEKYKKYHFITKFLMSQMINYYRDLNNISSSVYIQYLFSNLEMPHFEEIKSELNEFNITGFDNRYYDEDEDEDEEDDIKITTNLLNGREIFSVQSIDSYIGYDYILVSSADISDLININLAEISYDIVETGISDNLINAIVKVNSKRLINKVRILEKDREVAIKRLREVTNSLRTYNGMQMMLQHQREDIKNNLLSLQKQDNISFTVVDSGIKFITPEIVYEGVEIDHKIYDFYLGRVEAFVSFNSNRLNFRGLDRPVNEQMNFPTSTQLGNWFSVCFGDYSILLSDAALNLDYQTIVFTLIDFMSSPSLHEGRAITFFRNLIDKGFINKQDNAQPTEWRSVNID